MAVERYYPLPYSYNYIIPHRHRPERLKMMKEQRNTIMEQLEELQKTLDILDYKCWYYETAEKAGTTSVLKDMSADEIPEHLRKARETLSSVHNRH